MFRYNRWANEQLFSACRTLAEAQLTARPPGLSGSVAELLTHIVGAQQTFILRTGGRQHEGELSRRSDWPGIEALTELARATSDDLVAIASALDDEAAYSDVDLPYQGSVYRFPRSFFLVHALEHGVDHRTEVKVGLMQLGIDTPDLDGWRWAADAGYGQQVTSRG